MKILTLLFCTSELKDDADKNYLNTDIYLCPFIINVKHNSAFLFFTGYLSKSFIKGAF